MSVGQRDPLVEYRRQGQMLFEEMQSTLRHDIVRVLLHAEPSTETDLQRPIETELTIAARQSVSNAGQIVDNQEEFEESDFKKSTSVSDSSAAIIAKKKENSRKKAHKAERQRKAKARKRK